MQAALGGSAGGLAGPLPMIGRAGAAGPRGRAPPTLTAGVLLETRLERSPAVRVTAAVKTWNLGSRPLITYYGRKVCGFSHTSWAPTPSPWVPLTC